MAESDEYLRMRLDPITARRLAALVKKLELNRSTVVRQAIRDKARQEGVEVERDEDE